MELNRDQYETYVKEATPVHRSGKNVLLAFLAGGALCTAAQALSGALLAGGCGKEEAGIWTLLTFIFAGALLTGLNVFQKLARIFGAGVLVPITGFANSVAAPALEYRAEGEIFGIGCKIFTISGPVILYGILSSWILGMVYWIGQLAGIMAG